ncbi:TPA: hypothetical protein ACGW3F_003330 [Bacillus paranthracis]
MFTNERTKEWNYALEEHSKYNLIRIFLNNKLIIAQPKKVSDGFRKVGFLDKNEIEENIALYVHNIIKEGLSIRDGALDEDEGAKCTIYTMWFHAFKGEEKIASMGCELYYRPGSYAGMMYNKVSKEVDEFMNDLDRLHEEDIVDVGPCNIKDWVKVKFKTQKHTLMHEAEFKRKYSQYFINNCLYEGCTTYSLKECSRTKSGISTKTLSEEEEINNALVLTRGILEKDMVTLNQYYVNGEFTDRTIKLSAESLVTMLNEKHYNAKQENIESFIRYSLSKENFEYDIVTYPASEGISHYQRLWELNIIKL